MTYFYIEPAKINSIRNTMRIVSGLRSERSIRKGTIIDAEVNGFGDWCIIVTLDEEHVKFDVECWLNSNQELINHYFESDSFWTR